jgi:hypothetical protein
MGFNQSKRGGLNMTLIIQDETWRKIATFKWNSSDKNKQEYIVKTLGDAYGISLEPKTDIDWTKD